MSSALVECVFLIITLFIVRLDCEVYQDRPKIKISDGDLILEPALDKNIYLRPNGPKSTIFIGQINILAINASNVAPYQLPASDNQDQYQPGDNSILQRLQILETKVSTSPTDYLFNVSSLTRRVNNLHRKVTNLQNQLTNLIKDQCESRPCQHGGTCLSLTNGYHCLCPSNWEGKDCDEDVNECRNFAGTDLGCQNGATCINKPGTYECLCKNNWLGVHCTSKVKDCSGGDFEMCGHGNCIDVKSGEGIKCICHQGWTTNSSSVACLTDINECESYQTPKCSANPRVECINLPGSFRCGPCPKGYEGDGFSCTDIDECTSLPNGGCSPLVTCHNTIGSFICGSCPAGYQGDGVTCTWRGSCNIQHGGCHPSAQCIENLSSTGQSALCICPEGMDGDGIGIHGCYVSTNNSSFGCDNNPCGAHGRCHPVRNGYTCMCDRGYGGPHCDQGVDACASHPCYNGGTCRPDDGTASGFRCECTAQYSGASCQVKAKTCGGVVNHEEGSIIYPITNSTYDHGAQCAWVIHTVPDKVINVTFSKFDLEKSPDENECIYDFLQIHDGRKSSSQLIGRFCGNNFPKGGNIISNTNNLYLWFHSDKSVAKDGFALHWTSITPECGGSMDARIHGHISSPGSPGPYPPNRDCYWLLTTTPGKRISLHFFALDLESHPNCSFDFLAIYDGEHITDPLIGKFCNNTQPAPLQSAGSNVFIYFHSDAYGHGNGFQMAYAPVEGVPGCGGYFTTDVGELSSPTYNGEYLKNLLCDYNIRTSAGTKIKLDFTQFKLERSSKCRFDYLVVYDGTTEDSPLVGKFCGTSFPKTYTSSSNSLYIRFRTDQSLASEGFKIKYEAICEVTLYGDSGVIKSPGYPFNYPTNKVCEYIIRTDPGKAIQLTFQDFDIEESRHFNCQYDNVMIRDGPDKNSTLLGKYCGGPEHTPPAQISTHNYMYIRFQSDRSVSGSGFYANYTTINIECGGIHMETTGLINHPSGEQTSYKNNQECKWMLIAPEGMRIKLTWNRFDIEKMNDCGSDYLELIETNYNNEDVDTLGKFCGDKAPPALTTATNRLKLIFKTDSSVRSSGFSVSYTFLDEKSHCGGHYIKSHGNLNSPGWPDHYGLNRDCTWIITMPIGQQIVLNISQFDLELAIRGSCNNGDYLDVRNGATENSPLIGRYCGKTIPKKIVSFSNSLYLHFHSDFYLSGAGFNIEWDGTTTGCGGTLTDSSGSLASPNYPNNYPENSECFYRIATSAGSRLQIIFLELDLERSHDCKDDYVEIFDGRDTSAQSLGRYCFMSSTVSIETSTNYAFIKFRSDIFINAKGFKLNYQTVCNNNVTGRYGVIESPNYPNNYPNNLNCLWTITVPKGNKINATFSHISIYKPYRIFFHRSLMRDCYQDFIQTKDGADLNFSDKLCGNVPPYTISTKSNSLQIKFSTGSLVTYPGFRLEWINYGCGGHISKEIGTISLDNISTMGQQVECEWLLETKPGKSLMISFDSMYMAISPNCTTDAIEIYNGENDKAPLITKLCQLQASFSTVQSDSNFMLIRFKKNSNLRDIHFKSRFHSQRSKCGGSLSSISGFIHSKNYPKNYENNMDCIWYITVPSNHRIELNVMDLDLYSSFNVRSMNRDCKDLIEIYDLRYGFLDSSNYTYRICPSTNTTQFVSKYESLRVQFKTNEFGTAKGFKMNYTMLCGAVIIADTEGVIRSYDLVYHLNSSCVWTIQAPTLDQKIYLTFTHISLPKDNNIITNRHCPSSFLRVFDGDDTKAPLLDEYCGRKVPPIIVSHGYAITIEFGSYTGQIAGSFSADYSTLSNACGGTLTAEEGTIASPNYPGPYPVGSDCEWLIVTSAGNTAYISFEKLDLEYSENCNEDYIEVRKNDGAGQVLGVYCGNTIPTNQTSASVIYIKFHSNNKMSGNGFLLHYGLLHENDVEGDNGEISSPMFPQVFHGPGEYAWRIYTSNPNTISLSVDRLEIPSFDEGGYNKLSIYDDYSDTGPPVEQLSGILSETKVIQSFSNVMYIKLTLDETNTGSLFHMTWAIVSESSKSIEPGSHVNCGKNETVLVLPGTKVNFSTPNYPLAYTDNLYCEWFYKSTVGHHLSLRFKEFKLEETQTCFADSVSIYSSDTPNNWKTVEEQICSSNFEKSVFNSSTYMKIKFKTDSSMNRKGFLAEVTSKCGGHLTDLSGDISYTLSDVRNNIFDVTSTICEWTVKVRPGRTIKLNFKHFNITNNNNVCTTSVVLRNGDSIEAPLLANGKYCGFAHENKTDIVTSSNSLFVRYTTKRSDLHMFQTFTIHYEEVNDECGSVSKLSPDNTWEIISSPKYPDPPNPYTECEWIFTAPPGEILRIDFVDRFDLNTAADCKIEVIEFRDGSTSIAPLIGTGRYCGRESPGTIKSSNNNIYIRYATQSADPSNGFKLNVSIDVCGGTINSYGGELKSPGYPHMQHFPVSTVCVWHIKGPPGKIFQIKPSDIDLPRSEERCATKVTIEEQTPPSQNSSLPTITILRTFCDHEVNIMNNLPGIETSKNEFFIKLYNGKPDRWGTSDSRGFRINFSSSRSTCGGTVTTSEGFLTTPNYPQETTLRFCHWFIRVPDKTRKVKLEIMDMNIEKQSIRLYDDNDFTNEIQVISSSNYSPDNNVIESSQNNMVVYLVLNRTMTSHRFKAKFSSNEEAVCGGDLTSLNQELTSPDIQQPYTCTWHYNNQMPSHNSLLITVKLNSTKTKTNTCSWLYDSRILFRFIQDYRIIKREFCKNIESEITFGFPTSTVDIVAKKMRNQTFSFDVQLKSQPCGGIVHLGETPVNILNISNYDNDNNDTIHCTWLVKSMNNRIQLSMAGSFTLDCNNEYIKIKQGIDEDDPLIGDFCNGKLLETPLTTNWRQVYIEYHSAPKTTTNIRLMGQLMSNSCGGKLKSYETIFQSPNYPKSYSPNEECTWEINSDNGFRISLEFIDRFAIEDTPNCTKDVIIIYDWKEDAYTEMARVCGRQTPNAFNSTHNRMKVVFRTDAETNLDGFQASWTSICGGNYIATEKEQFLYSPGYPFNYHPLMSCSYKISSLNNKVLLKFLTFKLEGPSPECSNDNVTILAGHYYDMLNAVYCGTDIPPVFSTYEEINMKFQSDLTINKQGFKISYSIFTCGGKINDTTILTSSPSEYYDENLNCTWFITAPPNKIVALKFQYIDIEGHDVCGQDYIALFNDHQIDQNKRLALLCGHINQTTILKSNGSKALLQFVTDSSVNFKGFKVDVFFTYSEAAGCGGKIDLQSQSQIIKTPHFGNNYVYDNFLDCDWLITAPLDTIISISFTSFHVSPCQDINQTAIGYNKCDCDLVEIRDGLNPNSLVIGTYCGHTLPPKLFSSGNSMTVKLHTDGSLVSSGFEATVSTERSRCGHSIISVSHTPQRFTSPGYEQGVMPAGIHCIYQLKSDVEPYTLIRITVSMDLHNPISEGSGRNNCNKDKLIISSNPPHLNSTLGKDYIANHQSDDFFSHANFYDINIHFPERFELCGHIDKMDYYVYGNTALNLIAPVGTNNEVHKGIEVEVAYLGFCGRNYTEAQGRVQCTQVIDDNEIGEKDCYTLITAPENSTISAYFISTIINYWSSGSYLDIYDGNNTDSRRIVSITDDYGDDPIFSTGRYLLLHNHNSDNNHVIYDFNYVTTDKGRGCGGKIMQQVGRVSSPLYPQVYRQVSTCEWELETPVGTRVLLHFAVFTTGIICDQNYLQLVDSKGEVVRTYCADESPADYTSDDNYVKIVFNTVRNNVGITWLADFVGIY